MNLFATFFFPAYQKSQCFLCIWALSGCLLTLTAVSGPPLVYGPEPTYQNAIRRALNDHCARSTFWSTGITRLMQLPYTAMTWAQKHPYLTAFLVTLFFTAGTHAWVFDPDIFITPESLPESALDVLNKEEGAPPPREFLENCSQWEWFYRAMGPAWHKIAHMCEEASRKAALFPG